MSGDVVDFAPVRRMHKPHRLTRPNWQTGSLAVPLAVLGAALGAASLFGEWLSISMSGGATAPAVTIFSLGTLGTAYVVGLVALVTVAALVFFGDHPEGTRNLRVAGIAMGGSLLAVVGAIASQLTSSDDDQASYGIALQAEPAYSLSWGIYAAFGAVIALGVALLLQPAPRRQPAVAAAEEEAEFEGDAVDLTVTVEPVRGT